MKLFTVQFLPVRCHFLDLTPKYLPQHPILENHQPMFSLCVTDQVSHPHKTDKITVL